MVFLYFMAEVKRNVEGNIHLAFILFSRFSQQNFTLESIFLRHKKRVFHNPSSDVGRSMRFEISQRLRCGESVVTFYGSERLFALTVRSYLFRFRSHAKNISFKFFLPSRKTADAEENSI